MSQVAIIHERFNVLGGAEKVTIELAKVWPDAMVFAALADPRAYGDYIPSDRISTSWLQLLGGVHRRDDWLMPLIPAALATARLDDPDLVVASHYAFANRIRVPEQAKAISYVHSPARWIWDHEMREVEYKSKWATRTLAAFAATQRRPDRRAAARMDGLIANSTMVAERIERYWGRTSTIVFPPADIEFFTPDPMAEREDFFLVAGRCVPYKRTEVAIQAANAIGARLVVVGEGRSLAECRAMAGPNVEFVGRVSDDRLRHLYRSAAAVVFPGVEDFGIVPVEAQACGTPIIGIDLGGLRDTVIQGVTGELVPYRADANQQARLIADVMESFSPSAYDNGAARSNAKRFGADSFRHRIRTASASFD